MKAVFDTNILVSGLFFGGTLGKVITLIGQGLVSPCFTPSTFAELERVLRYEKFEAQRQLLTFSISDFLLALKARSLLYPEPPVQISIIKDDPSDNKFLACAITAQSPFIISGDNHLLRLKTFRNIAILTPRQFLNTYFNLSKN